MRFEPRLRRLERSAPPEPPCRVCGAPQRTGRRIIITSHADPLPTCAHCGRPLDEDGTPLAVPLKRIILDRGVDASC